MALPAGTPHVAAPAVAALGRGCTCCEKRADLVREVARLAARPDVDYVLVEAAGSAYPQEVAEALVGDGHGDGDAGAGRAGAGDGVAIDTMVTVVDAGVFLEHLAGDLEVGEVVGGVNADADADADADAGGRTVAEVLAAQVEFCDVVVVNKIDTVPGGGDSVTAQQVLAVLRKLNPTARIVLATHGHVDPTAVVGTGLFDMDRAAHSAGWMHELSAAAPTPEPSSADAGRARPARVDGRGGVESFVYRARRPFSAARLADALELPWDGLLRSKGYFWLATRGRISGLWQTAGKAWSGEPVAPWQATLPPDAREPGVELEGDWDAVWGDRQTEVVFVGVGMDEAGFRARLDGCLLSDAEMSQGEGCWAQMEDPLPPWEVAGGVH
ncbi:unnamed protein product [Pedinophyceae sp. YPF-701]|nr:unnamed protein product [Pedinophyceae sp. YPF-701]